MCCVFRLPELQGVTMQDTVPKILTLSHCIDNISEDKTDSLLLVHYSPTFPHTDVITWSLVTEEIDEIFQEFDPPPLFFFLKHVFTF